MCGGGRLQEDWTEPSESGEGGGAGEEVVEFEVAEEGKALAEGQLKGETEAAYWERQMAMYAENEAREQMEREIADGTMDAAEGARALTLLALPAAAAEAAGEDEVGEEVCAT